MARPKKSAQATLLIDGENEAVGSIVNPSVLAYLRHLDPSDAVMRDGAGRIIQIREKSVRGTMSSRLGKGKDAEKDAIKLEASFEKPNLQTVDTASLPVSGDGADTLSVSFTLRVLGNVGVPSVCNSPEYRARMRSIVADQIENGAFDRLGLLYAWNIANGRFLWRNRLGAESIMISVVCDFGPAKGREWVFDAFSYSLLEFDEEAARKPVVLPADFCVSGSYGSLASLGEAISEGLSGDSASLFRVSAVVKSGVGQEVYPSQEMIMDRDPKDKSKTLYFVDTDEGRAAALHSQKIGNALRTVDLAHNHPDKIGPIAVEPYGSVTTDGRAYRAPSTRRDFYNLMDNWALRNVLPEAQGDRDFVMAVLVRGGVFGESGKDK